MPPSSPVNAPVRGASAPLPPRARVGEWAIRARCMGVEAKLQTRWVSLEVGVGEWIRMGIWDKQGHRPTCD